MEALVSIETICTRYGVERHKAGEIMDKLPCFRVGNKRFAHEKDLTAWERGQMIYPVIREKTQKVTNFVIERRRRAT
jgi:hypothetical protein